MNEITHAEAAQCMSCGRLIFGRHWNCEIDQLHSELAAQAQQIRDFKATIARADLLVTSLNDQLGKTTMAYDAAIAREQAFRVALIDARTILERSGKHPDIDCDICPLINRIDAALALIEPPHQPGGEKQP